MGLIYFLFFFSGASALIYEFAWLRLLSLAFGNTIEAASCVISVFLGGLAVGAFFGGRLADRLLKGHLTLYGILELSIGLIAPFIGPLLCRLPFVVSYLSQAIGEGFGAQLWVRFLLAIIILLPLTVLMGASLPVLCKYVSLRKQFTKGFAALYAVNTLGGVFGGLDGCVYGFAYLGISGTVLLAAGLNIYVGLRAAYQKEEEIAELPTEKQEDASSQLDIISRPPQLEKQKLWFLCLISLGLIPRRLRRA